LSGGPPTAAPLADRVARPWCWRSGLAAASRVCYVGGLALTPWLIAQVNTLFGLAFLFWLAGGRADVSLRELAREPLVRVFVAGFALLALAAFASPMPRGESIDALSNYRELLLAVPMVALFRDRRWRQRALVAFGASGLLLVIVSTALWLGFATSPRGAAEGAVVLRHYLTHSTVVGTLAIVAWLQADSARDSVAKWLWRLVSLWSAANVLLMVPGRTGYLIVAAGVFLVGFRRAKVRGVLVALLVAIAIGGLAYKASDTLQARVDAVAEEASRFAEGKVEPTSTGTRLLFWASSVDLVRKHPWFGTGLGSWQSRIAGEMSAAEREKILQGHEHPHNELLHVAVQTGLVGAALYLFGLAVVAGRAWRLEGDAGLLGASLLAYFVGSLVNAFLWDSVEGQVFTALAALAVAGSAARIGHDSDISR